MSSTRTSTIDGNEAAASVAYRLNDLAAIYPITPSSPMGEFCDEWSAEGKTNIWGTVPEVIEMHGSIMHLRCEADASHPQIQIAGAQPKTKCCSVCRPGWSLRLRR